MFTIFVNSIAQTPLSCDCHQVLYADDILLFKPIDNQHDLQAFQNDLQLISNWIQQHGLNPNHEKTQLLIISRSRKPTTLSISLNGHTLTPCSEVKYLGVTISNDLTWSRHINNITKSTKRLLGRIHRKFHDAPSHLHLKVYQTTVLPKLDYCCAVWDPTKLPTGLNLKIYKNSQAGLLPKTGHQTIHLSVCPSI